jgi:preprotein translocase subunit SecB
MTDAAKAPGIRIAQIFLEQMRFAHRPDALTLPPTTRADVGDVEVYIEAGIHPDGKRGLARLRVSTEPVNKPIYDVSVTVAGLFAVSEAEPNMPLADFMYDAAPALLYPFAREAFANVTMRGRFGPVWLNPINARVMSGRNLQAQPPQSAEPAGGEKSSPETSAREAMLKEQTQK